MNEGTMDTEFDRATRLIWEDDSTIVMEATDLLKNAHVIEMRSLAKVNCEMIEIQRKRIAELEAQLKLSEERAFVAEWSVEEFVKEQKYEAFKKEMEDLR